MQEQALNNSKRMMRVIQLALLTLLAIALVGCTISSKTESLAVVEGPVRAELFRLDEKRLGAECAGGHSIGFCVPETSKKVEFGIKVATDPVSLVPVYGCTEPEGGVKLAVDEGATRVAYRCRGALWAAVYLDGKGGGIRGEANLGTSDTLDWSTVPTFENAAVDLFSNSGFAMREDILERVKDAGGDEGLVEFLVKTADQEPKGFHHQVKRGGAWGEAAAALSKEVRTRLGGRLVEAAFKDEAESSDPVVLRAILHGKLTREHAVVIAKRARRMVEERTEHVSFIREMIHALFEIDKEQAADLACVVEDATSGDELGAWEERTDIFLLRVSALRVMAKTEAKCEAVRSLSDRSVCDTVAFRFSRGGGKVPPICGEEVVDKLLTGPIPSPSYKGLMVDSDRAAPPYALGMAVACKRKAVSTESEKRYARFTYELKGEEKGACQEADIRRAACDLAVQAKKGETSSRSPCRFTVDDRGRTITVSGGKN